MRSYVIDDVWMALKLSLNNLFMWLIIVWGMVFFTSMASGASEFDRSMTVYFRYFALFMTPIVIVQSIIIYLANRRYTVDLESGLITFPKSDVENSILEIVLLYPYWNLMRTKTIHAEEIENVYLDTKRWTTKSRAHAGTSSNGREKYVAKTKNHVRYAINIAGAFGSSKFEFLDRQKRDEVRNAIQQCLKKYGRENVDMKVSELS